MKKIINPKECKKEEKSTKCRESRKLKRKETRFLLWHVRSLEVVTPFNK